MDIYHERQLGHLCGVHCLNNLLQGPHFGPGDLAEIGTRLDLEELALLGAEGDSAANQESANVDASADGGNFSIQVLTVALEKFHLELLPAKHPSAAELMQDPSKAAGAFLCQYKDHWFVVREVAGCWWNLNSTRGRPGHVGHFYLAAWLSQLSEEGHSLFLVRGAPLPEPAVPDPGIVGHENFHAVAELLEHSGQAGDRPTEGGDQGDLVVIPPDNNNPTTIQQTIHATCPSCSHVNEISRVVPASMKTSSMRAQCGVCGRQFNVQVANEQAGTLGAAKERMSHAALAASTGLKNYIAPPPPFVSPQPLRDMGFRDPQIRAAMALAGGNLQQAREMLLLSVAVAGESGGQAVAKAIEAGVMALDRPSPSVATVLRLVGLLCGESELQAAASFVDWAVLTEFVLSVLSRRGDHWPPGLVTALSVAVDLLVAAPLAPSAEPLGRAEGTVASEALSPVKAVCSRSTGSDQNATGATGVSVRFPSARGGPPDYDSFCKALRASLTSLGAEEAMVNQLRLSLRDAGTVAELRGPSEAINALIKLPLLALEARGHRADMIWIANFGEAALTESL